MSRARRAHRPMDTEAPRSAPPTMRLVARSHGACVTRRASKHDLRRRLSGCLAAATGLLLGVACRSSEPEVELPTGLVETLPIALGHRGPAVAPGGVGEAEDLRRGPARFVPVLHPRFDRARAMGHVAFADGSYRAPANDGYERLVARLLAELYAAGFGVEEGFGLELPRGDLGHPAWTPDSAVLEFVSVNKDGSPVQAFNVLGFGAPDARERAMLPLNAPGCDLVGPLADGWDALTEPGMILLTGDPVYAAAPRAAERGAVAVLSSYLAPSCVDPSGAGAEENAIHFGAVRPGTKLPCFHVPPRVAEAARRSAGLGGRFHLAASVHFTKRPLQTILATVEGSELPDEVVYVVGFPDRMGASDGAAGVAAALEGALLVKELVETRVLPRPRRTLAFLFDCQGSPTGASDGRRPIASLLGGALGSDPDRAGSAFALECADHGDEAVDDRALALVLRQALVDVSAFEQGREGAGAPWLTAEIAPTSPLVPHGGARAGAPGCRLGHAGDFARGTSLDRLDHIDEDELRRGTVALLAGALAVADARPTDLARHLDSLNLERQARLDDAVRAGGDVEELERWKRWFDGSRQWLRALCLGVDG